jgi:hypothetical protein
MRAKEFISEEKDVGGAHKIRKDLNDALPNAHMWPDLDNSSGYLAYRFGVALAGLPDYKMDVAGPTGLKMVTIGYTQADEEILNAAQKLIGTPKVRISSGGSKELSDTNKTSPVANWMKGNKEND